MAGAVNTRYKHDKTPRWKHKHNDCETVRCRGKRFILRLHNALQYKPRCNPQPRFQKPGQPVSCRLPRNAEREGRQGRLSFLPGTGLRPATRPSPPQPVPEPQPPPPRRLPGEAGSRRARPRSWHPQRSREAPAQDGHRQGGRHNTSLPSHNAWRRGRRPARAPEGEWRICPFPRWRPPSFTPPWTAAPPALPPCQFQLWRPWACCSGQRLPGELGGRRAARRAALASPLSPGPPASPAPSVGPWRRERGGGCARGEVTLGSGGEVPPRGEGRGRTRGRRLTEVRPPRPVRGGGRVSAAQRARRGCLRLGSPARGRRWAQAFPRYLGSGAGAGRRSWAAVMTGCCGAFGLSRCRSFPFDVHPRGATRISIPLRNYISWVGHGSKSAAGQTY